MSRNNEYSVGEAIEKWLVKSKLKEKSLIQIIISDWEKLMGKPISENTEQLWFSDGVFYVRMKAPAWKQELHYGRSQIRETLNKAVGAQLIKEVRVV